MLEHYVVNFTFTGPAVVLNKQMSHVVLAGNLVTVIGTIRFTVHLKAYMQTYGAGVDTTLRTRMPLKLEQ